MPALKRTAVAFLALTAMTGQLAAAPRCATQVDVAAFRSAAIQQQLMVAALTCRNIDEYNRFVIAYRPELQKSDNDLKSYFIRQGSEAAYDTFKTKLANLSSLSDIANGPAYCANAAAAFDIALSSRQSLDSFVADQRLMIALPQQTLCEARPLEAAADKPQPQKALHDRGDYNDDAPPPRSERRMAQASRDEDANAQRFADDAPPPDWTPAYRRRGYEIPDGR